MFRHIILGYETEIFTDHQPLRTLLQSKLDVGQLGRWSLLCQEFDIKVTYIRGKANILADTLSRIYSQTIEEDNSVDEVEDINDFVATTSQYAPWTDVELKDSQFEDDFCKPIIDFLRKNSKKLPKTPHLENYFLLNDVLMFRKTIDRCGVQEVVNTTVIPKALQERAIRLVHSIPWSGHMAKDRTYIKANRYYTFSKMQSKIEKFIKSCTLCQTANARDHVKVPARKYPLPSKPFERVAMDILGPLPLTVNGNKYILVLTDYLTRFSVFYALPDRLTHTVIKALKMYFNSYDSHEALLSDNAAEFTAGVLKDFCQTYGVRKLEVSPYHPNSNGIVERVNSRILRILKVYCVETNKTNDWDEFIQEINSAVNTSFNKSIGDNPFFILFNFDKSSTFATSETQNNVPFYAYDDYFRSMQHQRKLVETFFKHNLDLEMEKYLDIYNKGKKCRSVKVGQRVYMRYVPKANEVKKLSKKWTGPMFVRQKLSSTKYVLESSKPKKSYTTHIDNILSRNAILEQNRVSSLDVTLDDLN